MTPTSPDGNGNVGPVGSGVRGGSVEIVKFGDGEFIRLFSSPLRSEVQPKLSASANENAKCSQSQLPAPQF